MEGGKPENLKKKHPWSNVRINNKLNPHNNNNNNDNNNNIYNAQIS